MGEGIYKEGQKSEGEIVKEESILIGKMVEINRLMPAPIRITEPFVEDFYNQFKTIVSNFNSTSL